MLRVTLLAAVGITTAAILLLMARSQVYDSNFYALSQVPSLLQGDHPYRDIFEPGLPLDIYTAAAVQWLAGYRIIGEFARQWVGIIAGLMIATSLGLQLSRSALATMVAMVPALLILAATPIYHHTKLFFFPLTLWLCWRYVAAPSRGRAAAMSAGVALAFLFRHDYGIYAGFAGVLSFVLARGAVPSSRTFKAITVDLAAGALTLLLVVGPWALVVQQSEGLLEYVRVRTTLYPPAVGYLPVLTQHPWRWLQKPAPSPAQPGVIGFRWLPSVDDAQRTDLERRLNLRAVEDGREDGVSRYEAADVRDADLLEIRSLVADTEGLDWSLLDQNGSRLPGRWEAMRWLAQMVALAAAALIVSGAWRIWRARRHSALAGPDAWQMLVAGAFLVLVEQALLRELSYMVVVAPIAAAMTAPFLVSPALAVRLVTGGLVVVSTFAAWVVTRETALFHPVRHVAMLPETMRRLAQSPPDYGDSRFRYVAACTAPGDRLLITGMTPLHVSYFTGRAIAGGHANWHHRWRTDPAREAESLALLQRQSVPIAISTADPILADMRHYPRIRAYLEQHYVPLGPDGLMLVDTRRTPVGRHAATGYPCFR